MTPDEVTRRRLLQLGLAVPLAFAACGGDDDGGSSDAGGSGGATGSTAAELAATPACDDGDEPTVEQTEGPYFKPRSPRRRQLVEESMPGRRLVVTGTVLTTSCRPLRRALLDFWQADARGAYDNAGYRLRGHQFTDDRGRFRLETVVPGLYPGRAPRPRQGPAARRSGADHAALLPRRAAQQRRRDLRRRPADAARARQVALDRALRLRPRDLTARGFAASFRGYPCER